MGSALIMKIALALLFVGVILCCLATAAAKKRYGLKAVKFGAWPNYRRAAVTRLMAASTKKAIDARAAHFVSPIL